MTPSPPNVIQSMQQLYRYDYSQNRFWFIVMLLVFSQLFVVDGLSNSIRAQEVSKPRIWKDESGKFEIEATFVKREGKFVFLERKSNGKVLKVDMRKLSSRDRTLITKLSQKLHSESEELKATKENTTAAGENKKTPDVPRKKGRPDDPEPQKAKELKIVEGMITQAKKGDLPTGTDDWFVAAMVANGLFEHAQQLSTFLDQELQKKGEFPPINETYALGLIVNRFCIASKFESARTWIDKTKNDSVQAELLFRLGRSIGFQKDVDEGIVIIKDAASKDSDLGEFRMQANLIELAVELQHAGRPDDAKKVISKMPPKLQEAMPFGIGSEDRTFDKNRIRHPLLAHIVHSTALNRQRKGAWAVARFEAIDSALRGTEDFQIKIANAEKVEADPSGLFKGSRFYDVTPTLLETMAHHFGGNEKSRALATRISSNFDPASIDQMGDRNLDTYLMVITGAWDDEKIRKVATSKSEFSHYLNIGIGAGLAESNQIKLLGEVVTSSTGNERFALMVGSLFPKQSPKK